MTNGGGPVAFCEQNASKFTARGGACCHSHTQLGGLSRSARARLHGDTHLLRRKTTTQRSPALTPVPTPPSVTAAPATIESLGQQLRQILPARRLHSVSLCDHEANVLWLSEGALGPDEHSLVVEALGLLTEDTSLQCHELAVEDGRLAVFLPVRAPTGKLLGIAMILTDSKSLGEDTLECLTAAPVRAVMLRLAVLLKPAAGTNGAGPAPTPAVPVRDAIDAFDRLAEEPVAPPGTAGAEIRPVEVMSAEEVNDILEFELTAEDTRHNVPALKPAALRTAETSSEMIGLEFIVDPELAPLARSPAAAAPAASAPPQAPVAMHAAPAQKAPPPPAPAAPVAMSAPVVTAAPAPAPAPVPAAPAGPAAAAPPPAAPLSASDPNVLLEVLPFAKLRPGGQTRRFQVLARVTPPQRDPAAQDAFVLQRLMAWLAAHRFAWNSQPTGFTLNLSIATLEDERFMQKIAAALNSHGIAAETLGFEITEALCTQRRAQVERFITQCEKVGAWLVIDDFSFDSAVLPLLRSRAVRVVKVDSRLTSSALKDKLSQALVVATVQAAKVLGIHCAAKKVDSQAALQWLTAIGCDFAQGAALAPVQSLDSLASSPDPTGLTAQLRPT
jgi:EAL domain-containing protein (putative c-di-GMP-specific phosphodiesterase class I)